MPARPQKPKPFVPTDIAKATGLAKLVGRGQCGRNGRHGADSRLEQRIARRQASVYLRDFVCTGMIECYCPGCLYQPATALKSGMYPIVACGGMHTEISSIEATLQNWLANAQLPDSFRAKVARVFPDAFHVREAVTRALKTVLGTSCETFE